MGFIFILVVGAVVYRAVSTALFQSDRAKAVNQTQVEEETLKKALEIAEKWQNPTVLPSPTFSPKPSQAEEEKLQKSQVKIAVYNGSKKPGLAAEEAQKLTEAGFSNIVEIKNASLSNYEQYVIQRKEEVKGYVQEIKEVLELSSEKTKIENLPDGEKSDIVVIIGRERR